MVKDVVEPEKFEELTLDLSCLDDLPAAILQAPDRTFVDGEGHVWTVIGPSIHPLYVEVERDDGLKSWRVKDWVIKAGLNVSGRLKS